jgi:hypothetical protein
VPYSFCGGGDDDIDTQIALISAEIQRLETLVVNGGKLGPFFPIACPHRLNPNNAGVKNFTWLQRLPRLKARPGMVESWPTKTKLTKNM